MPAVLYFVMPWRVSNGGSVKKKDVVAHDITERKKVEEKLRRVNEELEQRVAQRTEELMKVNKDLLEEINERKQMEALLREQEERYRAFFDTSRDCIFITSVDGRWFDLNSAAVQLFGYGSREELLNVQVKDLYANPDQRKEHLQIIDEQGYLEEQPISLRKKDGTIIYALITSVARKDKTEKIIGYQGTIRDITRQKRADEEIRRVTAFLDSIVENIPNMIFVKDAKELRFILFNRAGEELLGYSRDKMLGKNDYDFFTKEQGDFFTEKDRDVLRTCRIADIPEEPIKTRNKGERILHTKKVPILNMNGEPDYLLGISEDITEHKRREKLLRFSEERFRSLVEATSDWLWETDAQGMYTYASPKVKDILGYEPSEVLGKTPMMLMPSAEAERMTKIMFQYFKETKPFIALENLNLHKEGREVVLETSGVPILDENGILTGYRGIDRDITKRKKTEIEKQILEDRLQQAGKMEALGTLAGGVAHDLNNIMGVIVGYAELLLMNDNLSSSIRPQLENIMKGGQRAAAIVDDLLTLARRGVPSRQIINLNIIVTETQQTPEFENLLFYHPLVKLNVDIDPDLLNVSGSSIHLAKTLFNLVLNASEAMPKGGVLTIKTANQYLDKPIQGYDEVREGDYVVLSVSDTGEGIPAANLKRIFEPFYTRKVMGRSGTGLGLAVVWGTVKDHMGYINVQSEEGKGSTFTLYFPVAREEMTSEAVAMAVSEYMGSGESILVVDDVKEQRELATNIFRKLKYNVASVSSGEEAIEYLKQNQVDLMVLDMIMDPGMDGLDTYKRV
ncbi:MAG: PAS domain S-box protein, partial [Syntrophaceae bacterium]|nr:PAS domain S-box protein [Syntrophaceae bacterium]